MLTMLLSNNVIPILNENDAITIRKQDYRDNYGKILWDNDSLATLVAKTLNVSKLVLVSNIDGVYDLNGTIIKDWTEEYYDKLGIIKDINYGRGGILSKLKAANSASNHGINTYIINGKQPNILMNLHQNTLIKYTYFKANNTNTKLGLMRGKLLDIIRNAKMTSLTTLRTSNLDIRRQWLEKYKVLLTSNIDKIISVNGIDLKQAEKDNITGPLYNRLRITSEKIITLCDGIDQLLTFQEPIGKCIESKVLKHPYITGNKLEWSRCQVPMGLILVIFESRPDVLVQLLSLAIISGNGMILKGGHEAENTLKYLFKLFLEAVPIKIFSGYNLLFSRGEAEIALSSSEIDLCIPRGSNNFIRWVNKTSIAPTIGHGEGICCAYIHSDITLLDDSILELIGHSKLDYVSACNSLEILVVNEKFFNDHTIINAIAYWQSHGILINVQDKLKQQYPYLNVEVSEHICEYGDNRLMLVCVKQCDDAISFINQYGSGHTDLVITDDIEIQGKFTSGVHSSCVFNNCSTRCADGYRMDMGCEVGINTNRHSWFRGPVGIEALMTTQIRLK
jgi:gamma-glutamyl phosphate reductase